MVVESVQGPGNDFAEEPLFRCEAATLATEPFLECPARARRSLRDAVGVGDETPPDLVKRVKRVSFGIRNFDHYRIRALLYAGRPNWALLPTITPP